MNFWAAKKRTPRPSAPIKVIDIDLGRPFPPLEGADGYAGFQAMVRLHGMPLGYVRLPVIAGCRPLFDLRRAILGEHSGAMLRHLLIDRLAEPCGPDRLALEEVIAAPHPNNHQGSPSLITVAVCTRGRASLLPPCLDALNRLDYPNLEILIVDNAPPDDATARLVSNQYGKFRYTCEPRPGLDWARNRAVMEAHGEILAYTDDDCIVDPEWAAALNAAFAENPHIAAVTGAVVPLELETDAQLLFENRGGFGKGFVRKWYTGRGNGDPQARMYGSAGRFGTGANMAFRLSLFQRIGLFDPALDVGTPTRGGGDLEMFFRVVKNGEGLLYEPGAIVRHRHRRTMPELRRQMADWGIGFASYVLRNFLAYPEERAAFLRLFLKWLWEAQIRRMLYALVRPFPIPLDMIAAEGVGALRGPGRYLASRWRAGRIEENFGPVGGRTLFLSRSASSRSERKPGADTGTFEIDLLRPLPLLSQAADYPRIRILVLWKGREMGSLEIENGYKSVPPIRLRQAVVDRFGLRLLDPEGRKNSGELQAEAFAALSRRYGGSGADS